MTNKQGKYLLWTILLVSLVYRLWGITNPLADFHHFRQTYTAMFAKHFYFESMNIFTPAVDILNYENVTEFQLYPYLVAILYKIFGYYDMIGRIVSVVFAVISTWLMYLLTKRYFDEKTALVSAALFAVLPMMVYYTRVFMLESTMIMLSILAIYTVTLWLDSESPLHVFWAILSTALMLLIKIPTVYMGLPIAFLIFNRYGFAALKKGQVLVYGIGSLLPAVYWYFIHPKIMHQHASEAYINNPTLNVGSMYFHPEAIKYYMFQLSQADTWKQLFLTRLGEYHLTYVGVIFLAIYFYTRVKGTATEIIQEKSEQNVFLYWVLGTIVFFVGIISPNLVHEYYQVPIIPAACPIIAAGFMIALRKTERRKWLQWAVILIMVSLIPFSISKVKSRLALDDFYPKIGERIAQKTNPEELIAILDEPRSEIFYFANRKGYYIFTTVPTLYLMPEETPKIIKELDTLIERQNIRIFVVPFPEFPLYGKKLKKYLDEHYTNLLETDDVPANLQDLKYKAYIYDLKNKK